MTVELMNGNYRRKLFIKCLLLNLSIVVLSKRRGVGGLFIDGFGQ